MAVKVPISASDLETLHSAVAATQTIKAIGCLGMSTAIFQITGSFTATVTFQGSADGGTTYVNLEAVNATNGTKSATATTTGDYWVNCAGFSHVGTIVTWTSGTSVTVKARALPIPPGLMTADIDASGSTLTVAGEYAEDAAHTSGDTGMFILGVRNDSAATTLTNTDGDYSPIAVDSAGQIQNAELAAPVAAGDTMTNPTTAPVVAFLAGYDGPSTQWRRIATSRGDGGSIASGSGAPIAAQLHVRNGVNTYGPIGAPTDTLTTSTGLISIPHLYNGTTSDLQRANLDVALLASASRTTTQTSSDIVNYNHRGIQVILDMTTVGTGSVTVTIDGKAKVGTYYNLLTGAAVTTNSTNVYRIYPGLTAAANLVANDVLPRTFRIVVTANNANAAVYSVDYALVV